MLNKKGANMKPTNGRYFYTQKLLKRDGNKCCGCGMKHQQHGQAIEADHIYSNAWLKSQGREEDAKLNKKNLGNFQLLCRTCNLIKRAVCFDARYRLKNFKGRISEKNVIKNQQDFTRLIGEIKENA